MYRILIISMNINIICHKHELSLIILTKMKRGKEGKKNYRRGRKVKRRGKGLKKNKLYYICVPTPQDDCKIHVLQTCTDKN